MPDYLQGTLSRGDAELIETHLSVCAKCGEMAALAKRLANLDKEMPSPALSVRFQAMLDAYEEGRGEKSRAGAEKVRRSVFGAGWLKFPIAVAASLLLVAAGFFGGHYLNTGDAAHSHEEITAMRTELTNMRQLVVLSMLQQESASERLQGVSWSTREAQADPRILSALVHTLRYDSSVDVRLAALDALGRYGSHPQVRQGLAEALGEKQSPLVQVELIDLLVQMRDRSVVDELRKIERDSGADPAVRQRAGRAISELS